MIKYTPQEAVNIQMGQVGSAVLTAAADDITPPTGCVIVAIQILASSTKIDNLDSEDDTRFINTNSASHDYATADSEHGTGGDVFPSEALYPGMVIYGRWTSVSVSQGSLIAYFGK
tara:strand:- start:551 stop:898 length:348 start_codon:yes stop_codon:yes gene_type:complete